MISIRDAQPGDVAFVLKCWQMSAQKGGSWLAQREGDAFTGVQLRYERRMVERCQVRVAYSESDPTLILGFAVMAPERKLLHWVYVRDAFRREGLARRLLSPILDKADITYTDWVPACAALPIPRTWVYDPRKST